MGYRFTRVLLLLGLSCVCAAQLSCHVEEYSQTDNNRYRTFCLPSGACTTTLTGGVQPASNNTGCSAPSTEVYGGLGLPCDSTWVTARGGGSGGTWLYRCFCSTDSSDCVEVDLGPTFASTLTTETETLSADGVTSEYTVTFTPILTNSISTLPWTWTSQVTPTSAATSSSSSPLSSSSSSPTSNSAVSSPASTAKRSSSNVVFPLGGGWGAAVLVLSLGSVWL